MSTANGTLERISKMDRWKIRPPALGKAGRFSAQDYPCSTLLPLLWVAISFLRWLLRRILCPIGALGSSLLFWSAAASAEPALAPPPGTSTLTTEQTAADQVPKTADTASKPVNAATTNAAGATQPTPGATDQPIDARSTTDSAEAEPEHERSLNFFVFADAHYAYTTARSGTSVAKHRAYEANAGDLLTHNGFNLSWLGIDAHYDGGEIGATGSLRFGSAVPVFYGGNVSSLGIENLTQAYASWRPADRWELDLGQFSTIYGAEVSESWKNLNYTRGALYYLMQPFWHTGLRTSFAFSDSLSVTGLVVNGVNTIVDDNDTPSLGLQLAYSKDDLFSVSAGYLGALRPNTDGSSFHHFFDLVASLSLQDFTLLFNGDLSFTPNAAIDRNTAGEVIRIVETPVFWGLSLTAGYKLSEFFGVALRGELLDDTKNRLYAFERAKDVKLVTLTGTIDVKPISGFDNLIVRWDNRFESSNRRIFFDKDAQTSKGYFESVLGVVVKTDE
jgi:hypothetical protein